MKWKAFLKEIIEGYKHPTTLMNHDQFYERMYTNRSQLPDDEEDECPVCFCNWKKGKKRV